MRRSDVNLDEMKRLGAGTIIGDLVRESLQGEHRDSLDTYLEALAVYLGITTLYTDDHILETADRIRRDRGDVI